MTSLAVCRVPVPAFQNPKDKRKIQLDAKLSTLFKAPLNMFSLNKQLSKHCWIDGKSEIHQNTSTTITCVPCIQGEVVLTGFSRVVLLTESNQSSLMHLRTNVLRADSMNSWMCNVHTGLKVFHARHTSSVLKQVLQGFIVNHHACLNIASNMVWSSGMWMEHYPHAVKHKGFAWQSLSSFVCCLSLKGQLADSGP